MNTKELVKIIILGFVGIGALFMLLVAISFLIAKMLTPTMIYFGFSPLTWSLVCKFIIGMSALLVMLRPFQLKSK